MEVSQIIDELEALVANAYYIPFTSKCVVDQVQVLSLIDRLRATLPSELAEAQRIKRARERILAQAEAEAENMRRLTRQQLEEAAAESEAVRLARVRAEEIVQDGERRAREMAAAALEYSSSIYARLEADLLALLDDLRRRMPVEVA